MAGPSLFIKNALRASSLGLGDGTIYASGSIANADTDISQANSTFTLTGFTLDALTGPDTDDLMNGYLFYFPSSGNKYHVVDWVAATDTATTHEMPLLTDTGACEFRRALFDNKALASNPLLYAADGRLDRQWKRSQTGDILVSLPNLIKENSGFEKGDLTGWVGNSTINSVSPILGGFDLSVGAGQNIATPLRGPIKATTYRLAFKARAAVWANSLKITISTIGLEGGVDFTFSNNSSGTIAGQLWHPGITSTNAWHSVDIKITTEHAEGVRLAFLNTAGTQNPFNMDEVYFFEKTTVSAFMVSGEPNSMGTNATITGFYAPHDRQGLIGGVDSLEIMTTRQINHSNITEFASGIFPIYKITFNLLTPSASQILLTEKWEWVFNPDMPFDSESVDYDEKTIKTRSGVESIIRHSKKRKVTGRYSKMPTTDRAVLKNDFFPHHIDEERHLFAYKLNSTDTPLFLRVSKSKFGINRSSGLLDDWVFAFDEVL